jgi:hydrogenase maturation factor
MAKTQSLFVSTDKNLYINLENVSSAEWDGSPANDHLIVHVGDYVHRLDTEEGKRFLTALTEFHDNLWVEKEVKTFD